MSKSQLDGGLQCKLFLHINGSLKYTNQVIQIPMEHFQGVCSVYRLSSDEPILYAKCRFWRSTWWIQPCWSRIRKLQILGENIDWSKRTCFNLLSMGKCSKPDIIVALGPRTLAGKEGPAAQFELPANKYSTSWWKSLL